MKKYAVLVIAVISLNIISSCSWAYMRIEGTARTNECYVGGEKRTLATFIASPANGTKYVFEMVNLPPGCNFEQIEGQPSASIVGIPTTAGVFTFTVRVSAIFRKWDYSIHAFGWENDQGSTSLTLSIAPSKKQGNNTNTGTGSSGGGGCNLGTSLLCLSLLGAFVIIHKK